MRYSVINGTGKIPVSLVTRFHSYLLISIFTPKKSSTVLYSGAFRLYENLLKITTVETLFQIN